MFRWLWKKNGNRIEEVNASHLMAYRASLEEHQDYFMIFPLAMLSVCLDRKYLGVSRDAAIYIDSVSIRPNEKGFAAATLCPVNGPLTEFERADVMDALFGSFEKGTISLMVFSICLLVMFTGRRPSQLADLKIGDLEERESQFGQTEYILHCPRRKQRDGWRAQRKEIKLNKEFWAAISEHARKEVETAVLHLGDIPKEVRLNLPLFIDWDKFVEDSRTPDGRLRIYEGDELLHMKSNELASVVAEFVWNADLPSRIPGKRLSATPVRFRRTVATEAVRENLPPMVVSEILDHEKTSSLKMYVANVPAYFDRITYAIADQLSEFVQAFKGEVIDGHGAAKRAGEPESIVRMSPKTGCGSCSKEGGCYERPPYACYTCPQFQPWLEAPHDKLLEELLVERELLKQKTGGDMRIISIRDRTIVAVTEVIRICNERKRLRSDGD